MSSGAAPASSPPPSAALPVAGVAGLIAAAAGLAYANSFSAPFLFDDHDAILGNASLRQLWPPWIPLTPPADGSTVTGRPLLNFTLACNYALGGTAVRGYHAVNLALHILAGLTLFGLIRRTLLLPRLQPRFGAAALPLAGATALLWVLHPLQTESVTYVIQRAECLVGLCYLLTLYTFVRSVTAPNARRWPVLAVTACTLGMASKEVMVSAPLIVWCYDRTLVSGGFRAALRHRPKFYSALAATWILLALLVLSMGGARGTSAGFGQGIAIGDYAATQCAALIHYLRLALWPAHLVFDYGQPLYPLADVLPQAALLLLLLGGTLIGLARGSLAGLVGAFMFAVLAPSSSLVPITTQTLAEHRCYLPLAGGLALLLPGLWQLAGRPGLLAALVAAGALGLATVHRNHDYRSDAAIWHDTARQQPDNPRAFDNLGLALLARGRADEAVPCFERALQLNPRSAHSHEVLAGALAGLHRLDAARRHYADAARLDPRSATAHGGLGALAYRSGDYTGAVAPLTAAIRLDPANPGHRRNLAGVLFRLGRSADSLAAFQEALRLAPTDADLHADYGGANLLLGRYALAIAHSTEALRLQPAHALARQNLAAAEAATRAPPGPRP